MNWTFTAWDPKAFVATIVSDKQNKVTVQIPASVAQSGKDQVMQVLGSAADTFEDSQAASGGSPPNTPAGPFDPATLVGIQFLPIED